MQGEAGWSGKVVVVTGGAMGIGEAAARLFAERGASVVIMDPNAATADVSADIEQRGGRSTYYLGSVGTQADVDAVCSLALDRFGRIDCLVNNAGVMLRQESVEAWTPADLQRVLDVNLLGTLLMTYRIAPVIAKTGGAIVNISSFGALFPVVYSPVYSATKAGVLGMTRAIAPLLAAQGVRVNAILPNLVDTPLTADSPTRGATPMLAALDVARVIVHVAEDMTAAGKFFTAELIDGCPGMRRLADTPSFEALETLPF